MTFAVSVSAVELANVDSALTVVEQAIEQAGLRRHSDLVSRVWVFCTPHFASCMDSLAHQVAVKTRCMNVWGGCVSGLLSDQGILAHQPALLVAIFGAEFEPTDDSPARLALSLAENEQSWPYTWDATQRESASAQHANVGLGLLSYGANYATMPRVEHARPQADLPVNHELACQRLLTLNSEGLEFLGDAQTVNECNGLFLIQAGNKPAAAALNCPDQQTKPVGLRLQVIHEQGESWIPVMELHADGTLGLAAPVMKGQLVRLARRSDDGATQDMQALATQLEQHFGDKPPGLGIIVAGFERSSLCHDDQQDIQSIMALYPNTQWIGLFGQASGLFSAKHWIAPPRNNRLCISLFDAPHV